MEAPGDTQPHRYRLAAGLPAVLALVLCAAGCTSGPGKSSASGTGHTSGIGGSPQTSSTACTRTQIAATIGRFFTAWNGRDAGALGRLFGGTDSLLDMATEHQDTLKDQAWTSSTGRDEIVAFAQRQWRLGERLSLHRVSAVMNGGVAGNGGYADVTATFPGGLTQPMEEAKFIYDCSTRTFAHVVIISAVAARQAAVGGLFQASSQLRGEVAYKCGDYICLMRPDGTGKRTLTATYPEWDPSWSPDGHRLAFRGYYGPGDGQYDLYAVGANGCHLTRLTHQMNGTSSSWAPAGRQIAFSVPLGMYVINADGTGLRKLFAGVSRYAYGVDTPAWSVRNRIAYARYLPSQHRTEIYTVNPDGSNDAPLTRGAPGFGQPAWSPDGKLIAYVAKPNSSGTIEVANADGTGAHRVSPRSWTSYSPTWTPGGKIVFLRQIGAPTQSTAALTSAYIVNCDGSGLRLLYPHLDAIQIAWGPTTLPKAGC